MDRDETIARMRNLFDLVAPDYDNVGVPFFQPIADGLVDAVGAAPGDRAADLGCGNGAACRALAAAVAPNGSLVALDLSPAMVDGARTSLEGSLSDVTFVVGDASDPPLPPGSFDVIISSLVVFFLPDPAEALSRWVRLLTGGGRIGVSTFGAATPAWDALEDRLRPFMPPMDPRMVGVESPFASDAGMERLLGDAGAVEVQTRSGRIEFAFEGFEHWVRFSRSVGQRVAWDRMSEEDTRRVLDETRKVYDAAAEPSGRLPVWQDVRYTIGVRPLT